MSGGVQLIFGTYNSIPIGYQESLREEHYQRSIKPFLSTLYVVPEIQVVLYYSGALLLWLEKKHPEFLDVLGEMISRKQVELLGGAFYDPVLTILPRSDALGQIEQMTTYIRKKFGKRPRGAWLAEMEWEPWLASTLKTCGIDYTFVGELYFNAAGISKRYIPYLTEDQGKLIGVFPLFDQISHSIQKVTPKEGINLILSHQSSTEERLITLMMPGERVAQSMDEFCSLLKENPQIEFTQPARYLKSSPIGYKTYFPCILRDKSVVNSNKALASAQIEKLPEGGFFRQYLALYPESNLLYAKMQYVHLLINGVRRDKYRKMAAREELWKGQYGKAYFSSTFPGGNSILKQAYKALISAERITREKGVFIPSIVVMDFDMDGKDEFLYQGNELNAYVHIQGGTIFELDLVNKGWNYISVPRKAFKDFFSPVQSVGNHSFDSLETIEGGDFYNHPYEVVKCDKERGELVLERKGRVKQGKNVSKMKVVKKIIFKGSTLNIYYSITNVGDCSYECSFGMEMNLSFLDQDQTKVFILEGQKETEIPAALKKFSSMGEIIYEDSANSAKVVFSTLEPATGWSVPLSIANDFVGFTLVPFWELTLPVGATWENRITLKLEA